MMHDAALPSSDFAKLKVVSQVFGMGANNHCLEEAVDAVKVSQVQSFRSMIITTFLDYFSIVVINIRRTIFSMMIVMT